MPSINTTHIITGHVVAISIIVCLAVVSSSDAFSLSVSPPYADLDNVIVGQTYDLGLSVQGPYQITHNCPAKITQDLLITIPTDAKNNQTLCTLYLTDKNSALAIPISYTVDRTIIHNLTWNASIQPTNTYEPLRASITLKNTGNIQEMINVTFQNETKYVNLSARQAHNLAFTQTHQYSKGIYELPMIVCAYECKTQALQAQVLQLNDKITVSIINETKTIMVLSLENPSIIPATILLTTYSTKMSNTTIIVPAKQNLTKVIVKEKQLTAIIIEQANDLIFNYEIQYENMWRKWIHGMQSIIPSIPWTKIIGILACISLTLYIVKKKS